MTAPNITCESMVVFVPAAIAPSESVARVRAGIFATLALWIGTPEADEVEHVPGGYRITVREASGATASAKRTGR